MTQTNQQRIDELEIKAAFQDQLIAELNDALIKQGTRLAALEQQLKQLIAHVDTLEVKTPDEKPPHY